MESNEMLKLAISSFFLFAVACMPIAFAQNGGQAATDHLSVLLGKANSVSFYFLSRTEDYSLRGDQFKAASTTRIYRACGNNCRSYMDDVLSHLRKAVPAECQRGQQNALIEVGTATVTYSYSGRMIEFEGKCYFNKTSIDNTIKNSDFLFK
jgi:hypothetical protein